ncbi:MAG: hypothetical protein GX092_05995 [Clostridia bacterium]|jgi:hypothetical protein|nr:hypothetical protein [Clostridia bacterium]
MVHQQIQQVQQRISSVSQMISQLRQSEENTRQRLMQLAQDEAYVAQQLQRVQQMCQESISGLQNISGSVSQQSFSSSYAQSPIQSPIYGQGISTGTSMPNISQSMQGSSSLFDLSTMNPQTYQNTMQFMGGQGYSGVGTTGIGQLGFQSSGISSVPNQSLGVGQIMGTDSSLSSISTMGPSTYQASREQLGKGSSSLSQIGQQAGINQSNKLI